MLPLQDEKLHYSGGAQKVWLHNPFRFTTLHYWIDPKDDLVAINELAGYC